MCGLRGDTFHKALQAIRGRIPKPLHRESSTDDERVKKNQLLRKADICNCHALLFVTALSAIVGF